MVGTVLRDELPRVAVMLVPRLLGGTERTSVSIGLLLQIEDRIDRGRGHDRTHAEHDSVLIGTHDVSDVVEHVYIPL